MENTNSRYATFSIVVIVLAIIVLGIVLLRDDRETVPNNQEASAPTAAAPAYKCGLTVSSPLPGDAVSFPLQVSGVINNLGATDNCTWSMFEGMGGTVTVSDANSSYATVGLTITGDWTGNLPVAFAGILNPPTAFQSGTQLTLTFLEEDPSGQGLGDSISIPVTVQ